MLDRSLFCCVVLVVVLDAAVSPASVTLISVFFQTLCVSRTLSAFVFICLQAKLNGKEVVGRALQVEFSRSQETKA